MKTVVLSLGGSILLPSIDSHAVSSYIPVLRRIGENVTLYVVVGGGARTTSAWIRGCLYRDLLCVVRFGGIMKIDRKRSHGPEGGIVAFLWSTEYNRKASCL